jgi:hypothetical protein
MFSSGDGKGSIGSRESGTRGDSDLGWSLYEPKVLVGYKQTEEIRSSNIVYC